MEGGWGYYALQGIFGAYISTMGVFVVLLFIGMGPPPIGGLIFDAITLVLWIAGLVCDIFVHVAFLKLIRQPQFDSISEFTKSTQIIVTVFLSIFVIGSVYACYLSYKQYKKSGKGKARTSRVNYAPAAPSPFVMIFRPFRAQEAEAAAIRLSAAKAAARNSRQSTDSRTSVPVAKVEPKPEQVGFLQDPPSYSDASGGSGGQSDVDARRHDPEAGDYKLPTYRV